MNTPKSRSILKAVCRQADKLMLPGHSGLKTTHLTNLNLLQNYQFANFLQFYMIVDIIQQKI